MNKIERYGVLEASRARDELDVVAEELRLLGYATLDAGLAPDEIDRLSEAFDRAADRYGHQASSGGHDLDKLGEKDTIRALPVAAPEFWSLVFNGRLNDLIVRLLGDYFILNQANGLINRGNASKYSQAAFHRDLPYQHFVASRPIAINALFALDEFTLENGATRVIPASHHREAFPSEEVIRNLQKQVTVPRGTYIVLDCMLYHAGATNHSSNDRRAVNHVFTIPMMRQQLHFPSLLGNDHSFDERKRRILGFGLEEYRSVSDWLGSRAARG